MNMNFGLQQIQTQKLVMTQELRQAISILQYSSLELAEYLHQQAHENPLIDIQSVDRLNRQQTETPSTEQGPKEIDWEEYLRYRASGEDNSYRFFDREPEEGHPVDRVTCRRRESMEHDLREQINLMTGLDPERRKIAGYLLGNLDERGYLDVSLEEVSAHLQVPVHQVEKALEIVQALEPAGIGARNLGECLTLQLKRAGETDPLLYDVIEHHLEDLAANKYQKIASALHVDTGRVQRVVDVIRSLNPKPGSFFYQEAPRFIIPDVTVEKVEGDYVVVVNEQSTPRLSINRYYENLLRQQAGHDDARQFIHQKLNSALWLIRSLEQRRVTLYRVTEAIMKVQRGFLEHGVSHLRPLTLRQIAEELDLHESTISRTTNNKYVQTPRGLYELKYFFTSGINRQDGSALSSESIKLMMKNVIEREDKRKPLSDQRIAEQLKQQGITISRRTVAKYREELNIPSSSRRKRLG
ncbi:MAG: RNA polymerase factor sigma-54 [Bacillaceae bacterium]|nr:RNA polymerase factor sigma-54 [Bacillaceae bacterium]